MRVAITGLGTISSLGLNTSEFWAALQEGRSGIRPLVQVPTEQLKIRIGAEVANYEASTYFEPKRLALLDRFSQFALIAAREAIEEAQLDVSGRLARETAVILGTGGGGQTTDDAAYHELYAKGNPRVNPAVIPRMMSSAGASQITMEFGITGPAFSVASACSSAGHAIGEAFFMLRDGRARAVIAGGTEACFSLGSLKAWEALRVMAPDTCRPFSRNRRGMVLGEGAGVMVLEPLEQARARGVRIHAELAGVGMSSDAGHIIQPSQQGAMQAMEAALRCAGLSQQEISYINAHGTGTAVNDVTEVRAIRAVFGSHADRLAVSSTKSMHGHALGAAAALETVASVLAVRDGIAPPTANFTEPDPECDLDCVPHEARRMPIRAALSNSFAFGGLNVVLALRRMEE